MQTRYPARAPARAMAAPIPRLAPVTRSTASMIHSCKLTRRICQTYHLFEKFIRSGGSRHERSSLCDANRLVHWRGARPEPRVCRFTSPECPAAHLPVGPHGARSGVQHREYHEQPWLHGVRPAVRPRLEARTQAADGRYVPAEPGWSNLEIQVAQWSQV